MAVALTEGCAARCACAKSDAPRVRALQDRDRHSRMVSAGAGLRGEAIAIFPSATGFQPFLMRPRYDARAAGRCKQGYRRPIFRTGRGAAGRFRGRPVFDTTRCAAIAARARRSPTGALGRDEAGAWFGPGPVPVLRRLRRVCSREPCASALIPYGVSGEEACGCAFRVPTAQALEERSRTNLRANRETARSQRGRPATLQADTNVLTRWRLTGGLASVPWLRPRHADGC
jgi:hypothetical protein